MEMCNYPTGWFPLKVLRGGSSVMIVVKFGGSSVSNITKIHRAASIVADKYLSVNEKVIVVVSAMSGVTDTLNDYLLEIAPNQKSSESDVVLSAGEQVTTALMAIALEKMGYRARSFLGWQIPIITNEHFCNARIINISLGNIYNCFDSNVVPIVSGFQGITENAQITTLGRGGSDTTAVAFAAATNAERCDIYTDVDGVYTADPKIVPLAKKIDTISLDEIFELSFCGAKVLQHRSVELAMKYHVKVRVLSTFGVGYGTDIVEDSMEGLLITGIASKTGIVHFSVVSGARGIALEVMAALSASNVSIDWLDITKFGGKHYLSLLVEYADKDEIEEKCQSLVRAQKITHFSTDCDVARIAIVGVGIGAHYDVIHKILDLLARNNVTVLSTVISPLSIRILTTKQHIAVATVMLHAELGLNAEIS
jgi:aspartate kinase